jgi:hypothetical protein
MGNTEPEKNGTKDKPKKTTPKIPVKLKENFEYYKERCNFYQKFFNLQDWEFYYKIEDDEENRGTSVSLPNSRVSTIAIDEEWGEYATKKEIDKLAFHEVMEVLFAMLRIYGDMFVNEMHVDREIHSVIRTMENVIFPLVCEDKNGSDK